MTDGTSGSPVAPTVALETVGCKLNQAETEHLARQFVEAGYRLVEANEAADVYILNTCTVTHVADRKSRHRLRLARRRHPGALIVATGCYAERAHQELGRVSGVNLIAGNRHKPHLVKLVEKAGFPGISGGAGRTAQSSGLRTRAFVPVQDGCDSACAYCIVPLVRGGAKSQPLERVINEVRDRVAEGYREVVLTGTEIGTYSDGGVDLSGLLKRLLAGTEAGRLRLSSLQPPEITEELVRWWQDGRLCRHFHLSLQSGSDRVLVRMRRRYATEDYRRAVSLIREALPGAAITTDVIIGFPGETPAEFEETLAFCQELKFARIHVFPFSPRPGTTAAQMPESVAESVIKQRSQQLIALAEESARDFRQRFLGKTVPVLWERQTGGIWAGFTDNYLRVYLESSENLTNQLLPVKLVKLWNDGVWGESRGSS